MTDATKTVSVAGSAQRDLLAATRGRWWEPVLWLAFFAAPFLLPQYAAIANEIAIVGLFAVSLDLVLGYAGIVSLGHAAYFGLGVYSAGLFAKHVGSLTIQRGTDLTRLMVTLGVALILMELGNKLDWLTGGADGLQGVVMGPLLGRFEFDLAGQVGAFYSITALLVFFLLARRLVHSPFGATLMAIRDNPLRAMSIGIPVRAKLSAVYIVAAGMAGASGALLAQTQGFASLDVFELHRSADVMLMLVIGGTGWLWGGVFGAIVFKVMYDILSSITPQYWTFWLGLFLVVLVQVGRDRLLRPWTWFARRQKGGA